MYETPIIYIGLYKVELLKNKEVNFENIFLTESRGLMIYLDDWKKRRKAWIRKRKSFSPRDFSFVREMDYLYDSFEDLKELSSSYKDMRPCR